MSRPATVQGNLTRLGFDDPAAAERHLAALGDAAEPLVALLARTADPDGALAQLVRLTEAAPDAPALLRALADDEGTAMRLLCVLGASEALADHLCRHPEHWRELTDPTLGSTRPAAYAVRERLLEAVGADPHDQAPVATVPDAEAVDALRVEYRRVLLRLAARDLAHDLAVDDAAAELSDLAAGTLEAALAVARPRVGETRGDRPAGRDRDGQVRRPRAQLRLRRRRHLRATSPPTGPTTTAAAKAATPAGQPPDAGLLGPHRRGHDLAGRRQPAPRGQGRAAGADAGQPPRLLRALGEHLGVPGAAQGPAGRRRPRAGAASTSRWSSPMVWKAAERDGFVEDTQAMRRRVVDHIPANEAERQLKLGSGRAARRRVRGPAAPAGARPRRRADPARRPR